MADTTPLFSIGFPPNAPTAQEQAGLSTQIAIARGRAEGIQQVAKNAVDQAMAGPMVLADAIVDQHLQPVHERLGVAGTVANALTSTAQNAAMAALQAPLRAGIALGYTPQSPQLLQVQRKGRQRTRKPPAGTAQAAQPPGLPVPVQSPPPGGAVGASLRLMGLGGPSIGPQPVWGPCPGPPGPTGWESPFLCTGPSGNGTYMWVPSIPIAGGNVGPTIGGGGAVGPPVAPPAPGGIVGPPIKPPSPKPPKPVPPLPPPPKSPCPCPDINISIPITPPPAPNVFISMPACPNCGNNVGVVSIPTPSQDITINTPPCPACNAALPPINFFVTLPAVPAPSGGAPQPTGPAAPPPASGALPPTQCPTCSIAWLNLNYPEFVLASRAATKSDYDILVDAITLKLCCGLPTLPGCSLPLLQREYPEFVSAAKAQDLSDDELLQQAVNIGLCADVPVATGLGEQNVGYIAPGSAAELEAEFDPTKAGEAPFTRTRTGFGSPGGSCSVDVPELPDLSGIIAELSDVPGGCLSGMDRPVMAIVQAIAQFIEDNTECKPGSLVSQLQNATDSQAKRHTTLGNFNADSLQMIIWIVRVLLGGLQSVGKYLEQSPGCDGKAVASAIAAKAIAGIWQRWVGQVPDELRVSLDHVAAYSCPTGLPTAGEANTLRAMGFISFDEWRCVVKADNSQPAWQERLVSAQQRRPDDGGLLTRYRQLEAWINSGVKDGKPLTPADATAIRKEMLLVKELWRHNGWTNADYFDEWRLTQLDTPSADTGINWMVKDVDDPSVVDTFKLDAEFLQKYGGRVQQVFQINGVRREDAVNYWRAHWRNMAPHQLYEMHKRLRAGWTLLMTDAEAMDFAQAICPKNPGEAALAAQGERPISNGWPIPTYCEEINNGATAKAWLESLVTDGGNVATALGQDDYPPFWRARLLALSYNVLTRVDARRAYEIGLFSDEKYQSVLQDRGYTPSDAEALTQFAHRNLVIKFSRSPTAKEWIQTPYRADVLQQNLQADGMRPDLYPEVLEILQLKVKVSVAIAQIRQIKKGVQNSQTSAATARQQLKNILSGLGG